MFLYLLIKINHTPRSKPSATSTANTIPRMAGADGAGCGFDLRPELGALSKPPKDRRLPEGLLEDLDLLLASDRQRRTTNTIDRYLISTTGNSIVREEEDRMEDTDEDLESDIERQDDAEEAEDDGKVVREEPARKTQNSEVNERLVRTRLQKRKLEQIGGAGNISQASVTSSRSAPKRQRKG